MTTISGTLTDNGVSATLRIGRDAEEVDWSFTGAPGAYFALERAASPSETSWEPVAGPFLVATGGRYKPRAKDRLRFRVKNKLSVTNGAFASDTGWTKGTGWTIAAGVADSDGSQAADSVLSQTPVVALVPGRSYEITYTTTRSGGTVTPRIGGTLGTARSSSDTFVETIVCGDDDGLVAFVADADFVGTLDDVAIAPNVAYTMADGDAIVHQLRDADGLVLETRTQAGRDIQGTLTVSGATTSSGATTLASTLDVDGAVTFGSTLEVTGASTLTGALDVTGAATLADTLEVTGDTTLGGALDVTDPTELQGGVRFNGATGAAALLNAYLDSTWTLVVSCDGTAPDAVGYAGATGEYQVVGGWCHFRIDLELNSWTAGSAAGNVTISLPVAPRSAFVPVAVSTASGFGTQPVLGQTFNTTARMALMSNYAGSTIVAADMSGNEAIRIAGSYPV